NTTRWTTHALQVKNNLIYHSIKIIRPNNNEHYAANKQTDDYHDVVAKNSNVRADKHNPVLVKYEIPALNIGSLIWYVTLKPKTVFTTAGHCLFIRLSLRYKHTATNKQKIANVENATISGFVCIIVGTLIY